MMKYLVVTPLLLLTCGGALADLMPASLHGVWETIPVNCSSSSPSSGKALRITDDDFEIWDWSAAPLNASFTVASGTKPLENIPFHARKNSTPVPTIEIAISPDGTTLTLDGQTFHRCPDD